MDGWRESREYVLSVYIDDKRIHTSSICVCVCLYVCVRVCVCVHVYVCTYSSHTSVTGRVWQKSGKKAVLNSVFLLPG